MRTRHLTRRPVFSPMLDTDSLADLDQLMAGFFRPTALSPVPLACLGKWIPKPSAPASEMACSR